MVRREANPCEHRIDCGTGHDGMEKHLRVGGSTAQAVTLGSQVLQKIGRSDAALCRGLRLGQIRRGFVPTIPALAVLARPARSL